MVRRIHRLLKHRSGNVAIIFALALLPVMGAVGAAVDFARISNVDRRLQNAVDTSAIAGLLTRSAASQDRHAAAEASLASNYNGPPATLATSGDSQIYTATADLDLPLAFMPLFGFDTAPVSATATAVKVFDNPPPCVLALNGSKPGAVTITGNADVVTSNCVIYSNSEDPAGMKIMGSANVVADGLCSAGGVQTNKALVPAPKEYCAQLADPFAHVPAPSYASCTANNVSTKPNKKTTLSPGVYCGGLDLKGEDTLQPGTYVIKNGGLKINSQADVQGTDVLFYFTGTNAGFDINGGASLDLKAQTTGPHAGILFMQDKFSNAGADNKLNGGSDGNLVGAVYAPTQKVTFNGNSGFGQQSPFMPIIADEVHISGSTELNIDMTSLSLPYSLPATESGIRLSQ